MRKLKQIDGNYYEFALNNVTEVHFSNPNNYADVIIDEWESNPYKHHLKPASIVLDIGANIGLFALHVMPRVKKIVCVEPTPEHFVIQYELLKDFHRIKDISHVQAALNFHTGKAKFRSEPVNTTMNTLTDRPDSFEVDCITLKDLCEKEGLTSVDFCKIDIEGSEWKALTIDTIKEVSHIIKAFWVELHPREKASQEHFKTIFEACGYDVQFVDFNGSIYCKKI